MPNTPCLVGQSAAAFSMGEACLPEDQAIVKKIFSSVGVAVEVKEKDLNGEFASPSGREEVDFTREEGFEWTC